MSDYLDKAAAHLDVKRSKIVDYAVAGNELSVLVDYGIGGIKKYRLSLDLLAQPATPAVGDDTLPDSLPDPAAGDPPTLEGEKVGYPIEMVAEAAEVEHLAGKLREAGFDWSDHILQADDDDLVAIPGIGKATARKLKEAAAELEND